MAAPIAIIRAAPPPGPVKGSRRRPTRYPFADLAVGDAFDVPIDRWQSVKVAARQATRNGAATFTTRKMDDATVRVWRIA